MSYLAENESGETVFVKALDFSQALNSDDPARVMEDLTEAFNFERDLLQKCADKKFHRIIRVLDDGTISTTGGLPVPYLVFEHAHQGDLRSVLASMEVFDLAFRLRALHHAAVGLRQLHSIDVAHQDVKPSNLVVFDDDSAKLADLGRSSTRERMARHDVATIAGDPTYCPPEQMYGYASTHWDRRRTATDLYHLGSMVMFMFTEMPMTQALLSRLALEHTPHRFPGTHEQVLPYVTAAFDECLVELEQASPSVISEDVVFVVRHLCHPDLSQRGHPTDHEGRGSDYSLQRFVTILDRMAREAEQRLRAQQL